MSAELSFILSKFTRLTDGRLAIAKTALHTMKRGKNVDRDGYKYFYLTNDGQLDLRANTWLPRLGHVICAIY